MATGQGSQGSKARPGHRRVAQWTRDYVRLPGIPDEYITQDGAPREVWTRFFDAFAALTQGEIERRFGSADRQLREAGVTYRPPGGLMPHTERRYSGLPAIAAAGTAPSVTNRPSP